MSLNDVYYLSGYLQWSGSFFIFLLCAYRWKYLSADLKVVGIYGGLSFFFQLLQLLSLYYFQNRLNNVVANIYSPLELVSLLSIFLLTAKMKRYRVPLITMGSCLLVLIIGAAISQPQTLNATSETVRDVAMIICSLAYFLILIKELSEENIMETPMFWINSSILFFFSCTFILSLSMDYIQEVLRDDFVIFWIFRNLLRTFFCVVICIGIWKVHKSRKKTLSQ